MKILLNEEDISLAIISYLERQGLNNAKGTPEVMYEVSDNSIAAVIGFISNKPVDTPTTKKIPAVEEPKVSDTQSLFS